MRKFLLNESKAEIRSAFESDGFVCFTDVDVRSATAEFEEEIRRLIEVKRRRTEPDVSVTRASMFSTDLAKVHAADRADFVHVLDAAHTLPGLSAMCAAAVVRQMLHLVGYDNVCLNMTPRVRFDFPHEDEFLQPEHQDHPFSDGNQPAVTVWFPLLDVTPEMGPLGLRPGSHKLGLLPRREIPQRPYILLEDGPWQTRFPGIDVCLHYGEVLIFHMDLIHKSGLNRSSRPRATIQLRYNSLDDADYAGRGWPPSYRIVSKKEQIVTADVTTKGMA